MHKIDSKIMNKKKLVKAIKGEIGKSISYYDILPVVNILIDELKRELIMVKKVVIPNFGKFSLKTFKPKMIMVVKTGERKLSKAYTSLRFTISPNIKNIIRKIGDL